MKPGTESLLIILGGSILGLWVLEKHFGKAFAAADDMKKMKMMQMMKMNAANQQVDTPKCMCADGMEIMAMKVPGQRNMFTCDGCADHMITGAASGVTLVPQSQGVRANQLQTVPNAAVMAAPGMGKMGAAGMMGMPGAAGMGATLGLLPSGTFQSGALEARAFAAGDDQEVADALKGTGVGNAEVMKLQKALMMQQGMVRAKGTCTCPDGTKVMAANGVCNCGAVNVAGAIGLNRNIAAAPMGQLMDVMNRGQRMRNQMMQPRQMRAQGGVSPTNTGQVCVLDPVSNSFVLSGTNPPVMCDPGSGITMAAPMARQMGLEQARNPLNTFSMVAPATLYAKAYTAETSTDGTQELPLMPCHDEDLYDDYGNLHSAYPNTHIQDWVSQYDEDSHTLPFFITEPENYRQISGPVANYPRR